MDDTEVDPWQLVDEIIRTNYIYLNCKLTTNLLLNLISNYSYNLERYIYDILIKTSDKSYERLAVKYRLTYEASKIYLKSYEPHYSDFYLDDWKHNIEELRTQITKNLAWRIAPDKSIIRGELPILLPKEKPENIQVWYQGYSGGHNLSILDSYFRIMYNMHLGSFEGEYFSLARI